MTLSETDRAALPDTSEKAVERVIRHLSWKDENLWPDQRRSAEAAAVLLRALLAERAAQDARIAAAEAADEATLLRIAEAIEAARCPHREGPYSTYDYSSYIDPPGSRPPYCVRDFRDPKLETWGQVIFRSHDRDEVRAECDRLTSLHIARAALAAFRAPTDDGAGAHACTEQGADRG